MPKLSEVKNKIRSCSKCGLCQAVCPIYKITGNDCTVSRGYFIMLLGYINGELKMSNRLNKYLDMCLKCGACSKFCPSEIDVVDIVALAKSEYFRQHFWEKFKSHFLKIFVLGFGFSFLNIFKRNIKSKKFNKKVIYFGGCKNKLSGNKSVIKILNACGIEVITPKFKCCGTPFFVKGDLDSFKFFMEDFYRIMKKNDITDIVTTCASCEKALKSYPKWGGEHNYNVKNIFEYIRENNLKPKLKHLRKVTFHKPCNIDNYNDIEWILNNTENLEYVQMENFDKCCGFNGISKFKEYKTMKKLFSSKNKCIKNSEAKTVLTSCLGCETALKILGLFKYKTEDFTEFLAKNI